MSGLSHRSDGGNSVSFLLTLRLIALVMLVVLMTAHLRSVRVFRWEQSVSGGVVVTFCTAVLGLALCAGTDMCGAVALQAYLCSIGAVLLAVNAAVIWWRWRRAGDLTRVVAELLQSMGVPLERHVKIKAIMSAAAALTLLIDLAFSPYVYRHK